MSELTQDARTSIEFIDPTAESNLTPVTIRVVDWTTGDPVAGATVSVGNAGGGVTDAQGRIDLGSLAPGSYSMTIAAPGYHASSVDNLANDSFTVEAS